MKRFPSSTKCSFFYSLLNEVEGIFQVLSPDLVILIDYPGFNLRLAGRARKRGMKTLFYVSPQIWAWHKGRFKNLVRDSAQRFARESYPFNARRELAESDEGFSRDTAGDVGTSHVKSRMTRAESSR